MSNIVSLRTGQPIVDLRESSEAVVEMLQGILRLAESGEIVGVALACEYHDTATTYRYRGKTSRATVGALMELVAELTK